MDKSFMTLVEQPAPAWGEDAHDPLWKEYTELMRAAHLGDLEATIRICSAEPEIINAVGGWNGTTALMLAARNGNLAVVLHLLASGASVNAQNSLGNTALMLAAEAAHSAVVDALLTAGSDVNMQNHYGQTAFMLTTENGHVSIVELLASKSKHKLKLNMRNKYDKSPLLVACQLGKLEIVEWILKTGECDVNDHTTHRGMTGLMYACSYTSDAHEAIVDLLLANGANVNACSKENDSALFWAAVGGRTSVVQKLLIAGAKVNQINIRGFTALMKAAENGNEGVVRCLIANGADKWIVNKEDKDAMKLAWLRGNIDMATNVFMIDDEFGMLTTPVTSIFTDEELDELGLIYSNPNQFLILKALVSAAARFDFHFDLFIRLLPRLQTPNSILNKQLPIFYRCFYERSKTLDVDLVFKLVQLAAALQHVELKHPLEKIDFKERNDVIMLMLVECVGCDCMEEEQNIRDILCFAIKWEQRHYRDELVEKAQTFRCGLLEVCVRNRIKAIFSSGHISAYVSTLFWGFLRKSDPFVNTQPISGPYRRLSQTLHFRYSPESENVRHLRSNFIHCRYCPAIMFIGEGISKCFTLFLLTHMSVVFYQEKTRIPYFNWEEKLLAIITVGMCLYEWGDLCENDLTAIPNWKSVANHLFDVFKWFDICSVTLLVVWLVFKFQSIYTPDGQISDEERVYMVKNYQNCLAISAITLSLGSLRYFSLWEPLGKLTIIVFAMIKDLASFAIFFLICIFGFCVAFFSIYRYDAAFATSGQTSLTLFSATLNNYDATFDVFSHKNSPYTLGIILEVIYILLSSVVLMNLVVARMAATHQNIDQRSFQEWQFATARTVKQFLLFEEKNPLCMLPAPLNLLPTILFPLHCAYLYALSGAKIHEMDHAKSVGLSNVNPRLISIAGSASDVCVGIVFSFIAPFIELYTYLYRMLQYKKRHRHSYLKAKSKKLPLLKTEPILIMVLFPIIYPFFVVKLLVEACSLLTMLSLEHTDQGVRRIVDFERRNVYRKPEPITSDNLSDVLTIKILRGEKLRRCYDNSNVAVKVRLDGMEYCTGSSIYRGSDPVFTNEVMQFPLDGVDFGSPNFGLEIEVVDRDIFTGFETVVGGCKMSAEHTRTLIANGRLEERVALTGGDGYIVCVGKVEFPTFLVEKKVVGNAEKAFNGAMAVSARRWDVII
jgi:ankyrin repeat protein